MPGQASPASTPCQGRRLPRLGEPGSGPMRNVSGIEQGGRDPMAVLGRPQAPGDLAMTSTQHAQSVADAAPGQAALVAKHAERLDAALAAIAGRGYWSAYPESPSPRVYGEGTAEAGKAAFEAHLGKPFPLGQPGADGQVGGEVSPYGLDLGVSYEHLGADALIAAASAAIPGWRAAGPRVRAAVCLEIIDRINARSFEIAHAVMHTSGQAFVMSFQAGGTHAQDRALEAVAYAYAEQTRHADTAVWEKPQGKRPPLRMEKTFTAVPRGIALVVGCTTFPTWNAYPGLFASLATGNAVIVKPHPGAVLPLAITVSVVREVLGEYGFDPNLALLAAEAPGERLAADLGAAIDATMGPDAQAVELLGAIVNDGVLGRLDAAAARATGAGRVAVPSRAIGHPGFPAARVRTPLVVHASADSPEISGECFGPVTYLVSTPGAAASVALFCQVAGTKGALTASVYSTDERYLGQVRDAALDVGVALSENLTGGVYVNQSAAFSDFHATGANPAANAAYTDGDFVAGRFRVIQSRRHLPG